MNPFASIFVKQGGEVARDLRMLTGEQIHTIIFGQALIDTARQQGVDLGHPSNLFQQHRSLASLQQLAQSHGLDVAQIDQLAASFDRGTYPAHAPKFMNIADMAGFLPKAASNTLLGAQAAARITETMDKVRQGISTGETLAQTLDVNNPRNKVSAYSGEPEYVEATQSADHLSRIMAAAVAENPQLAANAEVKNALTALELLAGQGFKQAAKDAQSKGITTAAEQMKAARASLRGEVNVFSKVAATSTLLAKVEKGMEAVAQANPQHAAVLRETMRQRKVQTQKLNVFGSLLAPDMLFTKKPMSFAESVTQNRGGQNSGHIR